MYFIIFFEVHFETRKENSYVMFMYGLLEKKSVCYSIIMLSGNKM